MARTKAHLNIKSCWRHKGAITRLLRASESVWWSRHVVYGSYDVCDSIYYMGFNNLKSDIVVRKCQWFHLDVDFFNFSYIIFIYAYIIFIRKMIHLFTHIVHFSSLYFANIRFRDIRINILSAPKRRKHAIGQYNLIIKRHTRRLAIIMANHSRSFDTRSTTFHVSWQITYIHLIYFLYTLPCTVVAIVSQSRCSHQLPLN